MQLCLPSQSICWIPQWWPSFRPWFTALCSVSSGSLSSPFWDSSLLSRTLLSAQKRLINADGLSKRIVKGAGEYSLFPKPFQFLMVWTNPQHKPVKTAEQLHNMAQSWINWALGFNLLWWDLQRCKGEVKFFCLSLKRRSSNKRLKGYFSLFGQVTLSPRTSVSSSV